MKASNSKITSFFKPKSKENNSSCSSSSSSSPGEKEVSSSTWDTVKPALVSVPVQVEVLVPQSPLQSRSVHDSAPISRIISKQEIDGVQVEECGRVVDDSSAIDASANGDDNDGIELDIQQSAESIDDRKADDDLPAEADSTSLDAASSAGHFNIAKPLDEATPPSDDATHTPPSAGSLIVVEDSAAVTVSISSTASEDDNSNQQEMSVAHTEEEFTVAAAMATEIKEKDDSDDDFLIANVPKRRLKRNYP